MKATTKMRKKIFFNRSTRSKTWKCVSSKKKEGKLVLIVEERTWSEETDLEFFF